MNRIYKISAILIVGVVVGLGFGVLEIYSEPSLIEEKVIDPVTYYETDPTFLKKENEILWLEVEKIRIALSHTENIYEELEKENDLLRKEIELYKSGDRQ